jgi:hypothetical protein
MNTLSPFLTPADAEATEPTHERIVARAREIWLESGRPQNRDVEIWLEAEAELLAICHHQYRHPHRVVSA